MTRPTLQFLPLFNGDDGGRCVEDDGPHHEDDGPRPEDDGPRPVGIWLLEAKEVVSVKRGV